MKDPRHTWAYQKARAQFVRTAEPWCCICGGWIDKSLSGRHPDGPTVEHRVEVAVDPSRALDVNLWGLAHGQCNASKGARFGARRKRGEPGGPPPIRPERDW